MCFLTLDEDLSFIRDVGPAEIFIRVDLPAALSPTNPNTSLSCSTRSTPRSARTAAKLFMMFRISTTGVASVAGFIAFP